MQLVPKWSLTNASSLQPKGNFEQYTYVDINIKM